uniref:Carrier domain-containing protein n=1 Tax=Fagus sylvatica TaxID=28930 RepID=A0A2N9HH20_FAGSY
MDTRNHMERQFSNLHPCFPVNTRIGIVGAGASGLSSAYALVKLGYNNVTVLEKYHNVGGMCESVEIEDDYISVISLTLELQDKAKNSDRIGVHAVSELASDLTSVYLEGHGLKSVPKSVAYGYTASGYGFVQDMPYAYIHEFTRTSMAGKIRRFKGGYTSLWEKISESLPIEVYCNTEVLEVRRNSNGVTVDVKNCGEVKTMEFDKIIISGSFPVKYGRTYRSPISHNTENEAEVMDMDDFEKELFSKVQIIDYYTTVLKIKGLEHMPIGFYYFGDYIDDPAMIGHPVAMQRFYADSDIFLFWSYGNSADIMGSTVTELAINAVKTMGGEVEKVVLQRRFKYFPHVCSQDMKDGFYEKLETKVQGWKNTYYVGGLMAFELTERNSSYAMALVCKHFANNNSLPIFPYVKRLFPLQADCRKRCHNELDELPGVEFPDLPSLDGYLKHWGTHGVTQNKTLYTWINEEGVMACQRTYAELHTNASCIAHKLLTSRKPVIKPGDRVLLVYVPGLDFIDAFFGCLRAKVLPVPVLPPDPLHRGGQALLKIENIAISCGAVAILSTIGYHSAVRAGSVKNLLSLTAKNRKSSARWPNLPWLHTDSWIKNSKNLALEDIADQSESQPDDLCFLQFTSGSTGDAKGVMITHGGLIHNVKLMRRRYKSTSKTVLISWLPQYHDMGLIGGLFTALVSGGSAILFSPLTFIKNPLLWLQTMSKYQATHSAGPNFAFELMIRRLEFGKDKFHNYDLSSMIFLMVAAEPVRQKTLKRFVELTRPFGLSQEVMAPGYGLAENSVFVGCAFGEGKPIFLDWQERVCCGYVDPKDTDVDIKIVNPETGEELEEDGKEGEIWISSPSAGIGYWHKEELEETFTQQDVENTVESSSEFLRPGCCAVIGVPEEILSMKGISVPDGSDQVGLVVIAEVRDEPILPRRSLVQSFTMGTCKEGKTHRPELVRSSPLPSLKMSNKEIVEFLRGLVSEQTGIPINKISATENLMSYGIDSIGVVRAAQKLSDFLGVPVGAVDIFTATCISDLASFSEDLLMKSQPQLMSSPSYALETEIDSTQLMVEISKSWQLVIWLFQLLALIYVTGMLVFPAYLSITSFISFSSAIHIALDGIPWLQYLISLTLAPLAWILCIFLTCICISFFGNNFLRPNYALTPEISIWSIDFVKWWALYKVQEISSKVLAVHLRGTVFLKYWFEMLGARIGSSVLLDTVDITDPSLVSIGDRVVIAEGALVQSHEVKNGVLSFLPIRISRNSSVGPYAVIQKGSVLGEEAEVPPLQKIEGGKPLLKSAKANVQKGAVSTDITSKTQCDAIYHFIGIYIVGFLSCLSAAILYFLYNWLIQKPPSIQHFAFFCISGSFHWIPYTIFAYAMVFAKVPSNSINFASSIAIAYLAHGLILSFLTCALTHLLDSKQETKQSHLKTWLRHRITIACHLRFAKFLSGTEAFCMYLRLLGAKVGKHCSIRAINPVSDPQLISIGTGVHLGDFSRIIAGFYSSNGFTQGKVEVQDNSVIGSQGLVLPGSVVQEDVILGALSVAPMNSILQKGGVYIGSQTPVMIKNTAHGLDERIEEMDMKYKKIIGNLAANLAATTLKVKARYFHRIGASGKGYLKIYDNIKGLPDHKIFCPGNSYPVIIRHSNCLSADDDARKDPRGAAIRILSDKSGGDSPLLDLTLKTGNAFHARTIADFATWLVCGIAAREEYVKRVPHVRDANWTSLRQADSYAELHYYSNICRLFRFTDGQEMYVKFKLRPYDETISEDSGKVEPIGILPPETGAIPRDENDTRPLLFLAEDFQRRMNSPDGLRYIFQLQVRPVPPDESTREIALDCTKPWDEADFPYIDIGEINIEQKLSKEESDGLEFNPFLRCHEVDVIRASSCFQSASMDHGRSLIYEICQHLRNGKPLPEAWRIFLQQSDFKVDLSGCPMAAALEKKETKTVTLARTWYQTLWSIFAQPLLQMVLPYFMMGLVIFAPLSWVINLKDAKKLPLHWLLPLLWVSSGVLAGLACVVAKWVLVGKKKEGEKIMIWSKRIFMDTIWQAFRTLAGEYFMEMTSGSILFVLWMKLMGSDIDLEQGAYVDSMGALLNPEMVEIERGGCVGREALLFGHIYEGEEGKVKYGKIKIGEGGFMGSRAVAMPGVRVESMGNLSALSLAMKEEIVKSR